VGRLTPGGSVGEDSEEVAAVGREKPTWNPNLAGDYGDGGRATPTMDVQVARYPLWVDVELGHGRVSTATGLT
jgi:hypothetical protein